MKITSSFLAATALLCTTTTTTTTTFAIDVGEHVPNDLTLHHGFPPAKISLDERFANKKVLLVGLPGAFTPT
jgi:peroxiredoxin